MLVAAESVEIGEDGVALHVARVADIDVLRVRVHRHHFLVHFLGGLREVDAVAQGLAHLRLAVGSRETQTCRVARQDSLRFHESLAIDAVEAAHDLDRLLKHRLLILAHRHIGGLERRDVRGLGDRVAEEAHRKATSERLLLAVLAEATHLDFRLDGRIALEPRHRDKVHVVECQFGELRNHALDEYCHFVRVEAD